MLTTNKETVTKKEIINLMLSSGAKINGDGSFYRDWPSSGDFMSKKEIYTEAQKIGLIEVAEDKSVWIFNQINNDYAQLNDHESEIYDDFDRFATKLKNSLIS